MKRTCSTRSRRSWPRFSRVTDMTGIEGVKGRLAAINDRAAEKFGAAVDLLGGKLTPGQLERWAELTLSMAGAGWHAWETSNVWCEISPGLLAASDADELLARGDFGFGLCGYSFEPSVTYFRGIQALLEFGEISQLMPIEQAAAAILEKFPHASGLLTDYLKTAFLLAGHHDTHELQQWTHLTAEASALSRSEITEFFAATRTAGPVDWRFIRELGGVSVADGLDYMRATSLRDLLDADQVELLQASVAKFAGAEDSMANFLERVRDALATLAPLARHQLLVLLGGLPQRELAMSLLEAVDRLPWDNPGVVADWASGVDIHLPLNIDAACGYLSLESATSVDRLQQLKGQVHFADCQRVLQLYAEAIVGRHLLVDAHGDQTEHFRGLPTTDGMRVFLPETMGHYPSAEDNFALYKMSLLHQLGYYEFGTFRFSYGGSVIAFSDYFKSFGNAQLAADIFQVLEDARVDWALARHYRGAAVQLERFKRDALQALQMPDPEVPLAVCLAALVRYSLDDDNFAVDDMLAPVVSQIRHELARLKDEQADVFLTMDALAKCYEILAPLARSLAGADVPRQQSTDHPQPIEVQFRGKLEPDLARLNLQLIDLEEEDVDFAEDGEDTLNLSFPVDPKNVTIEQLKQGDVQEALGMMITELEGIEAEPEELEEEQRQALEEFRGKLAGQVGPTPEAAYRYDEWDCVIEDYRRRWCTLYEIRNFEEQPEFVEQTLKDLPDVARKVRRQLNNLKPELLRKVKGVEDGEDLDLERAVELLVDKRAGLVPDGRIYIERLRKDRDVSALFLLDMSASTDDRIPEPEIEAREAPQWDKDDFLHDYHGAGAEKDQRKRIIDLEKEAVVLMAEALEGLGDAYSVCGFSGYGKDQVDFYLCKDFEEPYNLMVKGRIGGIKPCRSTRMGPAIRHATRRLVATESRIKAMIIISDGYPQDYDYGKDRNSKDYGIKDTTMALSEARQKGVQTFCLTVDPSGHDYLREMCPDQRYMVIQDINQLPDELSKVYRSLTG